MLALQLLKTRERRESEGGSSFSESSASSHRPPAVEAFSSMQMGFQRLFWKEAVGKRDVSSIYRLHLWPRKWLFSARAEIFNGISDPYAFRGPEDVVDAAFVYDRQASTGENRWFEAPTEL